MYNYGLMSNSPQFEDLLSRPETQRTLRLGGVFLAPFTGFLWGMLIGGIFGPKGERWDTAIDAGMWTAVVGTGHSLACVPEFAQPVCSTVGMLPFSTAAAVYVTYQHRKGER